MHSPLLMNIKVYYNYAIQYMVQIKVTFQSLTIFNRYLHTQATYSTTKVHNSTTDGVCVTCNKVTIILSVALGIRYVVANVLIVQ